MAPRRPTAATAAVPATVRRVSQVPLPTGERIVIELNRAVRYKVGRLADPDRLYIDFSDTTIPTAVVQAAQELDGTSLISQVRAAQHDLHSTRVVLELRGHPRYNAGPVNDPFRFVIELQPLADATPSSPAGLTPTPGSGSLGADTASPDREPTPELPAGLDSVAEVVLSDISSIGRPVAFPSHIVPAPAPPPTLDPLVTDGLVADLASGAAAVSLAAPPPVVVPAPALDALAGPAIPAEPPDEAQTLTPTAESQAPSGIGTTPPAPPSVDSSPVLGSAPVETSPQEPTGRPSQAPGSRQTASAPPRPMPPPAPQPTTQPDGPQVVPPSTPPGQSVGSSPPKDLGTLQVSAGEGVSVTWPESSVRVALSDDSLAMIHVISRQEILVNGLKAGRTSLFVWFAGGRSAYYHLVVTPNYDAARQALRDLNPSITLEPGPDAESVILRGDVADEGIALQARALAEQLLPRTGTPPAAPRIVNLLRYAGGIGTTQDRLESLMTTIDPRIRVRRVQVGLEPNPEKDSYILEGRVRDVNAVVQAVVLADRQLGGTGKTAVSADSSRVTFQRNDSGTLGSLAIGGNGGGGLQALQGVQPPQNGLAAQLSRGLLLTSESGRVVSFLQVDSLPQVLVSIRVLEIDRNKARNLGVDLRVDEKTWGVSSSVINNAGTLGDARASNNTASNGGRSLPDYGNVAASIVHDTLGISAALDLLTDKQVARSIAEPNVLTLSGEQASVLVGGEVPIPGTIANQVAVQSGFSFESYGVRLDIRPTLDANGVVTLEVAPSIVTPSASLGTNGVPGFSIQRVETTARVPEGQSLVLGGLLQSSDSVHDRGIPLLDKIPLFRWQGRSTSNMELLFVITPRVIEPPSPPTKLPPLEFQDSPNHLGVSGLDTNGVPFTFEGQSGTVAANIVGPSGSCAELRDAPNDQTSNIVGCLLPDSHVIVTATQDNWLRVHAPTGEEGWVLRRWIHVVTEKH